MKLPCALVRDLLPLYHDNVCAPETNEAVEEHLSGCEPCQEFYHSLQDNEKAAELLVPEAASLQRVKKKIHKKYILVAMCVLLVCGILSLGVTLLLNKVTIDMPLDTIEKVEISTHNFVYDPRTEKELAPLNITFTDTIYAHYGLNRMLMPMTIDGEQKWVLLCASRVTLGQDLHARWEKFIGAEPITVFPYETSIITFWEHYKVMCRRYIDEGVAKPPKDWDYCFSELYFFPDYDDYASLDGLSPEEQEKMLEKAVLLWEKE